MEMLVMSVLVASWLLDGLANACPYIWVLLWSCTMGIDFALKVLS